jgi:hypothetical protein
MSHDFFVLVSQQVQVQAQTHENVGISSNNNQKRFPSDHAHQQKNSVGIIASYL